MRAAPSSILTVSVQVKIGRHGSVSDKRSPKVHAVGGDSHTGKLGWRLVPSASEYTTDAVTDSMSASTPTPISG